MNQQGLPFNDELIVDNFAGGGGASIGIEQGIGRPVDIAINHDAEAVAMHRANHPETQHYVEDVWRVDPVAVTRNQPIGLAWFSPDCKHFSKAKGGRPVSKKIRGLAWIVVRWAKRTRPRVIMLENVEEFQDWGPVNADGMPCKDKKGQTFARFVGQLERLGYRVEKRQLRACDYGAPTIRKRLFMIARRDGLPIVWPEPTHGDPETDSVRAGRLLPWRSAAECIDWSIPCPSIFERKRPLADNTLKRIARGIDRFVVKCPDPFIVRIGHSGWGGDGMQYPMDSPLTTITSKAEHCLAAPFIAKVNHGYDFFRGQDLRRPIQTLTAKNGSSLVMPTMVTNTTGHPGADCRDPVRTVTSGNNQALVASFMAQHNTGVTGHPMTAPISTITGRGTQQNVVAAHLINQKGTTQRHQDARSPTPTICAGGNHAGLVAALMAPYYSSGSGLTGRDMRNPSPAATTKARFQLITVDIDGETYVLEDIGMRMLQPHELYAAQGFPRGYIHQTGIDENGSEVNLTKTAQVRMCGNSVCPPLATALVRANFEHEQAWQESAA